MERNKGNKEVRQPSNSFSRYNQKYTGDLIDKLYLDEDRDNVLLELDDHVRDMTPEYLRKEKLFY